MLGHNYVKIGHLIQKKIFWEILVPQFLSIVPYAAKLEKKIIREDHEIHNFVQQLYQKLLIWQKKKKVIVICWFSALFHATNIEKKIF